MSEWITKGCVYSTVYLGSTDNGGERTFGFIDGCYTFGGGMGAMSSTKSIVYKDISIAGHLQSEFLNILFLFSIEA